MCFVPFYYMHTFLLNSFSKRGEREGKERGGEREERKPPRYLSSLTILYASTKSSDTPQRS